MEITGPVFVTFFTEMFGQFISKDCDIEFAVQVAETPSENKEIHSFGGFQAAMPLIGWFLGKQFQSYITNFDHWVAFLLLAFIGIKMIVEAVRSGLDAPAVQEDRLQIRELVILALATSIDALAVGITFAFLQINIWAAISIIGITTFILSFLGVMVGNRFGVRYKQKAEIAGGVILVLIGLKILLEHLELLPF